MKHILLGISIVIVLLLVAMFVLPSLIFTGVTYDEAVEYIEMCGYPEWATDLNIEMTDFVDNKSVVYINNTGTTHSYRPTVEIRCHNNTEFWIHEGEVYWRFEKAHSYLTLDGNGELKDRLEKDESWRFVLEVRNVKENDTCELVVNTVVLGGWGYQGNCMYGEITHINTETIVIDEYEFQVVN